MDLSEKIVNSLTREDIVDIMSIFGVAHENTSNGDLKFESACHGSVSKKLYYYEFDKEGEESKHFLCYSTCGGMSIFTTFMQINNWDYEETISYLANYKGISAVTHKPKKFGVKKKEIADWDFINQYKKITESKKKKLVTKLPSFDEKILNIFDSVYPSSWESEGISLEAMKKFEIGFHLIQWKASMPHRDIWGRLIGIRGRSFLQSEIDGGKKYMPMYLENNSYRHPLQQNLYGMYNNIDTIRKLKKVIMFEGEKSVLLCETFYPNNNFSVAICGSNMNNYQKDLLLYEGNVEEVIIALDKQYKNELLSDAETKEYEEYIKKVEKIANKFVNYVNVYIVYCDDSRLDYKDSPTDKGKAALEQLMREKERYVREES